MTQTLLAAQAWLAGFGGRSAAASALRELKRDSGLVLYRVTGSGRPRLLSVAVSPDDAVAYRRLANEHGLRHAIGSDWGVAAIRWGVHEGRAALLADDPGGVLLSSFRARPTDRLPAIATVVRQAIAVARALDGLHGAGLLHGDVKPENVLLDGEGQARLLGFGLAAALGDGRASDAGADIQIQGSLAYLAPERTGRTSYPVDARADLYALGVVLYELLTGSQPFQAADVAEWVHCHLARRPAPPSEKRPQIPAELSRVVMTLLEKAPEDRYPTAAAAADDLSRWLASGAPGDNRDVLAGRRAAPSLQRPTRMYGRDAELQAIEVAFQQVRDSETPGFVLISGPSGVGKSCLVERFGQSLHGESALFAAGKCDQYIRDIPYHALSQCLDTLIRQIAARGPTEGVRWRALLAQALAGNGALMVNLVPALEMLTGPQPEAESIGPQEDQSRFRSTLRRFLRGLATGGRPLVLFLDDIQWMDGASLELLRELAADEGVPGLLIIAAYRDNEPTSAQALDVTLRQLRASAPGVVEIGLEALGKDALGEFVADIVGHAPDVAAPLAELVRQQTSGNPYFTIQCLRALVDGHAIGYDRSRRQWEWNLDRVRDRAIGASVVDLMRERIRALPYDARMALACLACLGAQADRSVLACALDASPGTVDAAFSEAVAAGLVVTRDACLAFAHDRVQEAAYAIPDAGQRAAMHFQIARRLLHGFAAGERRAELAFDIATQFLKAVPLAPSSEDAHAVASVFDLAGDKAKAASAYDAALKFFATGAKIMRPAGSGGTAASLSFALERKLAECEFLTGRLDAARRSLIALRETATTISDRAEVAWLLVTLYTALDRSDQAIATCLAFLEEAGVPLQRHASLHDIQLEYHSLLRLIGEGGIGNLVRHERLADPRQVAVLNVLAAALPPAFFSDEKLVCQILCRMATISVRFGNSDASPLGFAYLGMVAGPVFGDYAAGYQFGRLGLDLVDEAGLTRYRPRVYMTFAYHVAPWTRPLEQHHELLLRAFDAAQETGDLTYAGFSSCTLVSMLLAGGASLAEIDRAAALKLAHVRRARFGLIVDIITAQRQLVAALRGETFALGAFDGEGFAEADFREHLEANRSLDIAACWYWIRKLQLSVYAGESGRAVEAADRAAPLLWSTAGHLELAEYHFFAGMAHAGCAGAAGGPGDAVDVEAHRAALSHHTAQLGIWAANAPDNFGARAAMLQAEVARVEGRTADAMREFERAIATASGCRRQHDAALAYERASALYFAEGLDSMGLLLLAEAAQRYDAWGARGKVAAIAMERPEIGSRLAGRMPASAALSSAVVTTSTRELDMDAIVQSLQAVSEETSLPRIVETLMTIALEQAGAERGALVLPTEQGLRCRAHAHATAERLTVDRRDEDIASSGLPVSVVQAAILNRRPILIQDAREPHAFGAEAYFASGAVRSMLCLPLMRQGEVIGILYLENNVAAGVFTPARTALLRLLASTAAIAIENASLDEKTVLLKEIHHRVKNNLQLISSLLSLQASAIDDPEVSRLFAESRDRVRSMALVHENLYRAGNFVRVAMAGHLRNLCSRLARAYRPDGQRVDIEVEADDIELDINRAIACGLIINELVSNALKHGFVDGRDGRVVVRLEAVDRLRCCLRVLDNGVGIDAGSSEGAARQAAARTGIGMDLVEDLAHQLGGEMTIATDHGTSVAVCFSLPDSEN